VTRSIGFLLHPGEQGAVDAAIERARAAGFATWTAVDDPAGAVSEHAEDTALLVTVGGDGTFLFGARLAAPRNIPVLGVNRGRLGFLTDVEVEALPTALEDFAAQRCHLQRRAMMEVRMQSDSGASSMLALNDAALKSQGVAVARFKVDADGELFGEFDADGLVVATATGSTAYALSAGGPPLDPRVPAIVVIPLAPHAVITRAVVLPEQTEIDVVLRHGNVVVAADGVELGVITEQGRVSVVPGPELCLVRYPRSPSFLRRLHDKMRFGMPLKPLDRGEAAPGPSAEELP
jgi:NAD+ kinase